MLKHIGFRKSKRDYHPELFYAYLRWDNNWVRPDFSSCGESPEQVLSILYKKLYDPKNLARIGKTKEEIAKLEIIDEDKNTSYSYTGNQTKIYIISYVKYVEGKKDRYGEETWYEGFKTEEQAKEKINAMKKEDEEKGWEYKYSIETVTVKDY